MEVIGSSALVGSSNFTHPGLTQNIELNVQITGTPVAVLQEWYDQHWDAAEDVTPDLLKVIERHVEQYSPFDGTKVDLLAYVGQRNALDPKYRYKGDEIYDTLVEELFRRYHPFSDELNICFAKRGDKERTHAFRSAIKRAETRFERDYGTRRSAEVRIIASTPPESSGLQAVDYFLWAVQRYYERREDRYIELLWDKVVEIEDMDRIENGRKGVTYSKKRPLIDNQGAL